MPTPPLLRPISPSNISGFRPTTSVTEVAHSSHVVTPPLRNVTPDMDSYVPEKITSILDPQSPTTEGIKRHALNISVVPGANFNDVWKSTVSVAMDAKRSIPSQRDIETVAANQFHSVFSGGPNLFSAPIVSTPPDIVAPKPKSLKRSSTTEELESQAQSTVSKRVRAGRAVAVVGNAAYTEKRRAADSSPLRRFSPFSKENPNKLPVPTIDAFNATQPENKRLTKGTGDYEKAKKRHSDLRGRLKARSSTTEEG